jgi:hypothetical protein
VQEHHASGRVDEEPAAVTKLWWVMASSHPHRARGGFLVRRRSRGPRGGRTGENAPCQGGELVVGAFGQRVTAPAYRAELRGVYGGLSLAFAGALAWAGRDRRGRRLVLRTVGLATAGIAAGRVVTAVTDGRLDVWPNAVLLATEVTMAASLLTA